MTESPDYFKATNAAYNILQNYPFKLATDIFQIINNYSNIAVHSYSEISSRFGISFQELLNQVSK